MKTKEVLEGFLFLELWHIICIIIGMLVNYYIVVAPFPYRMEYAVFVGIFVGTIVYAPISPLLLLFNWWAKVALSE